MATEAGKGVLQEYGVRPRQVEGADLGNKQPANHGSSGSQSSPDRLATREAGAGASP